MKHKVNKLVKCRSGVINAQRLRKALEKVKKEYP